MAKRSPCVFFDIKQLTKEVQMFVVRHAGPGLGRKRLRHLSDPV